MHHSAQCNNNALLREFEMNDINDRICMYVILHKNVWISILIYSVVLLRIIFICLLLHLSDCDRECWSVSFECCLSSTTKRRERRDSQELFTLDNIIFSYTLNKLINKGSFCTMSTQQVVP